MKMLITITGITEITDISIFSCRNSKASTRKHLKLGSLDIFVITTYRSEKLLSNNKHKLRLSLR